MKTEKKIPFDLRIYKSAEFLRIETGDGKDVKIVSTEIDDPIFTIAAIIENKIYTFTEKGNISMKPGSSKDLFLILEVEIKQSVYYNFVGKNPKSEAFWINDNDHLKLETAISESKSRWANETKNFIKTTIDQEGQVYVENLGRNPKLEPVELLSNIKIFYCNVYTFGVAGGLKTLQESRKKATGNIGLLINRLKVTIINEIDVKIELIGLDELPDY